MRIDRTHLAAFLAQRHPLHFGHASLDTFDSVRARLELFRLPWIAIRIVGRGWRIFSTDAALTLAADEAGRVPRGAEDVLLIGMDCGSVEADETWASALRSVRTPAITPLEVATSA